jgi:hypothetical protein
MNMRDYPTLHLDTNYSNGSAYSKKGYGCKFFYEHERLSNIILRQNITVKEQLVL